MLSNSMDPLLLRRLISPLHTKSDQNQETQPHAIQQISTCLLSSISISISIDWGIAKQTTMADEFDSCSSSDDAFKESATPLSSVAEAFEDLSMALMSNEIFRLGTFCDACSLVSVLFSSLGIAFRFAEYEYVSKVNDLLEASKTFDTLSSILDYDVANDSVKKPGSLSRHLRRVRQGLDLIKALFENFLSSSECSLRDAASTAYTQVCAPYHTWTIRKAVSAGMYALPTREQLLLRLNETDETVEKEMRRYIVASSPIIKYIDDLYISRDISLDW